MFANFDRLIADATGLAVDVPSRPAVGDDLHLAGLKPLDERRRPKRQEEREKVDDVVERPKIAIQYDVDQAVVEFWFVDHVDAGDALRIDDQDQRVAAFEFAVVVNDPHPEFGNRQEFFRALDQVGQIADFLLQAGIRDVADIDVCAVSGHIAEIAIVRFDDVHFHGMVVQNRRNRFVDVFGQAERIADVAARSRGNVANRRPLLEIHHSVHAFVERAVAADDDEQIVLFFASDAR